MTEEEAMTKWCPLSLTGAYHPIKCCTSDCMMWEWDLTPDGAATANALAAVNAVPRGHCGLVK